MIRTISAGGPLRGEVQIPGDKSISHRAVMFGALARGVTEVSNFLMSADCLSTIACFERLGICTQQDRGAGTVLIHGRGLYGLSAPSQTLDAGNSGTTARLLSGILAGQPFPCVLDGDASLQTRPMQRVMDPLSRMGAAVRSLRGNRCLPLQFGEPDSGSFPDRKLHAVSYHSPVASAQVKSCVLLAGLYADGVTSVLENTLSRDHTERMLAGFGADVVSEKITETDGTTLWKASVGPEPDLAGQRIEVPGDISSAAYFIAAALTVPGSELLIRNVGVNPTRAGILKVAGAMGGRVTLLNEHTQGGEPAADLLVQSSSLHGTVVEGDIIPSLIDELPVIAVMAAFADGETVIRDAAELKVKESDRIETTSAFLCAMGADVTPTADGMVIRGGTALHGAQVDSCRDHRIAMSASVAALAAEADVSIRDAQCVDISYPEFYRDLLRISRRAV